MTTGQVWAEVLQLSVQQREAFWRLEVLRHLPKVSICETSSSPSAGSRRWREMLSTSPAFSRRTGELNSVLTFPVRFMTQMLDRISDLFSYPKVFSMAVTFAFGQILIGASSPALCTMQQPAVAHAPCSHAPFCQNVHWTHCGFWQNVYMSWDPFSPLRCFLGPFWLSFPPSLPWPQQLCEQRQGIVQDGSSKAAHESFGSGMFAVRFSLAHLHVSIRLWTPCDKWHQRRNTGESLMNPRAQRTKERFVD